ncbi:MAG TPA: hypothetical protein PK231_00665 [Acidocella sp.]|nr:MAG: hypothetical protein B7W99_00585 [Rhodospirillales bacterium 20-58-10]HQT37903.1 hypothetical protein [Acidocella sp.]
MDKTLHINPSFIKAEDNKPALELSANFVGFVGDEESLDILREALSPIFPEGLQLQKTDFQTSLTILGKTKPPQIILVDISQEERPLNAMMDLAEVVAPETSVFVIGESNKVSIYRTITKDLGVKEYLVKPLTVETIRKCFSGVTNGISKAEAPPDTVRKGAMIAIAGMRGGIGCSTIAINLAWMIGVEMRRHTLLLDADLYTGTDALYLNLHQNMGLCMALETPHRVDSLLVERSAQNIGTRLQVLSSNSELEREMLYSPNGASSLLQTLTSRFTSIIADTGHQFLPFARDLLQLANQTIVVMDPSKVSIINWERFESLPLGPLQVRRRILLLNRAKRPGGLSQSFIEQAIGRKFDIVIPDMPRVLPHATQLGTPAADGRGPFRDAISQLASLVTTSKDETARG